MTNKNQNPDTYDVFESLPEDIQVEIYLAAVNEHLNRHHKGANAYVQTPEEWTSYFKDAMEETYDPEERASLQEQIERYAEAKYCLITSGNGFDEFDHPCKDASNLIGQADGFLLYGFGDRISLRDMILKNGSTRRLVDRIAPQLSAAADAEEI